jgi:pectate lyase-like protein
MNKVISVLAIGVVSLLPVEATLAQVHSELWGVAGEKWGAESRLPNFSYAGYHCGEADIPDLPVVANVRTFGAKGDGEADDTQAFLNAIAQTDGGAIYIPPGRYKLTKVIEIRKPNLVLRGAGPDQTTLYFPTPLNAIKPNWGHTTGGRRTSNYSWSGGLLWIKGSFQSTQLAEVTAPAQRHATGLEISTTDGMKVGDQVEIFLRDDAQKSLTRHLYSGDPGDISLFKGSTGSLVVTVQKIAPQKVVFDRPLRFAVELAWTPIIRRFAPTVREVGIENLCIEFPPAPYNGHFSELGYNAIAMSGVADCWVRNVKIMHADSGMFLGGKFCTVTGVNFESRRKPNRDCTGHHGVILGGTDNLFTDFRFDTKFIHDLGVSKNHAGNVFSNGSGVDLNFDHHRRAPYENLYTDLDVGLGSRMWACGGGRSLGKHCGARGTFWGIRAQRPQKYPGPNFGPVSMNLVGIQTNQASIMSATGKWFEAIDPLKLEPQNLHQAQLQRRLAILHPSSK